MRRLLAAAVVLLPVSVFAGCGGGAKESTPSPPPPLTTTTTAAPTQPTTTTAPPVVPAMSWQEAGAFVWHETDISPEALGQELRANGFGWVALFVQDGVTEDPVEGNWIARFRAASGLPVGGWGALRTDPVQEARLASSLVARDGLDFYIADAEAEYAYSGAGGPSRVRFDRSREFVSEFRRLEPALPAAVSSYCRPDQHDLDWKAWSAAGFAFLPQAYVNDFGMAASPSACANGAAKWFPRDKVHPVVGSYSGLRGLVSPETWGRLLSAAGTTGFAIYPAEVGLSNQDWAAFGQSLRAARLASLPG